MSVKIIDEQRNQVEILVTAGPHNVQWILTCLYGSPRYQEKKALWENITTRSQNIQVSWMIIGDLNITINAQEKTSSAISAQSSIKKRIKEWLLQTDLLDITFLGHPYTWSNHIQATHMVQSKLDRAMANSKWHEIFQSAKVHSLTAFGLYHSPILLHTNPVERDFKKPFRVYENWIQQDS
ncbi:hypothetical protein MKX03_008320, partial [Papaver bracteatum]